MRQRGAAGVVGNQELTSELARLLRSNIKLRGASRKTRMSALRNPKGTTIASRRGMEKIIYDFYSDLFNSHVHLPPHNLREDGEVIPEVLPSEIRHAIMSVRNRTAPGPTRSLQE
ncbi:hypothetical protein RB195_023341 [Necator americanus]|uniref:Uncharacterized protein n=1 Tax=Necator americanus TaxID=51031 RepID=A0ABR1EIR3_NECAM